MDDLLLLNDDELELIIEEANNILLMRSIRESLEIEEIDNYEDNNY